MTRIALKTLSLAAVAVLSACATPQDATSQQKRLPFESVCKSNLQRCGALSRDEFVRATETAPQPYIPARK